MRPHHNPENVQERHENEVWLTAQLLLQPEHRDPEWVWHPESCNGMEGAYYHNLVLGLPRVRPRREVWNNAPPGMAAFWPPEGAANGPRMARMEVPVMHEAENEGFHVPPRLRRERDEMPRNAELLKQYPELNLDKVPQGAFIPRDVRLAPFKVEYDSHEQINTKLNQTVIMIKEQPFQVIQTCDMGKGKFGLIVCGSYEGAKRSWISYDNVADCRGIAPGYVNRDGGAYWLFRVPERQNQQGMHPRNTYYRQAGTKGVQGASANFLLSALANRKDMKYSEKLDEMFENGFCSSVRLSNNVALYKSGKKGAIAGVEYCGRPLGLVVKGQIKVFDENDLRPSWIHKDLAQIDLAMGV